jgi:hypothetical protein
MKSFFTVILGLLAFSAFAQNEPDTIKHWKVTGVTSLTINQASFTNWSAGGENSISGTALLKLFANYTKGNFSWNNTINLKYGLLKNESESLKKNDDLIELNTQLNHQFAKHWSTSGLVNLTTQFTDGYNYPDDSNIVSKFFAPAYLTIAPGVSYKPTDYFSILITPITMKGTFVMDQQLADLGAFGVDAAKYDSIGGVWTKTEDGKNSKIKLGAFVEFYFKKKLKEDLAYESKLNLFYNYLQDNNIPEGIMPLDFNWQNYFLYKISKVFSASLFFHLAYMPGDVFITRTNVAGIEEITVKPNDKLQIKENFGIGLAYTF